MVNNVVVTKPGRSRAAQYATPFTSTAPPPTPGTINPGELLVDAQYKTMWLGVDDSIDPIRAILIIDMAALIEADAQVLADAQAYTRSLLIGDSGLPINPKGYSGRDHTHTHNDITDWDAAIAAAINAQGQIKTKMIVMWSGLNTDVPTGWQLCDGTNGTPDLRDRFVLGSGNRLVGALNPTAGGSITPVKTTANGAHNHTSAMDANDNAPDTPGYTIYWTLTATQIPKHSHPYVEDIQGSGGVPDGHSHLLLDFGDPVTLNYQSGSSSMVVWRKSLVDVATRPSPVAITIGENSTSTTPQHRHEINWQKAHQHTVPADFYATGMPWYALAYIMKL